MHGFFNLIFHLGILIYLKIEELWIWEFEDFSIFLKKVVPYTQKFTNGILGLTKKANKKSCSLMERANAP